MEKIFRNSDTYIKKSKQSIIESKLRLTPKSIKLLDEKYDPMDEYSGEYYISLDGNVDENSVFGKLILKGKKLKVKTNYYDEEYTLESAANSFIFKGKTSSVTISNDFTKFFTPKSINNKNNFVLVRDNQMNNIDPNNFELPFTFADPEAGLDQNNYDAGMPDGLLVCKNGKLTVKMLNKELEEAGDPDIFDKYVLSNQIENKNSVQCEYLGAPITISESVAGMYETFAQIEPVKDIESAMDLYSQLVEGGVTEGFADIAKYSPEIAALNGDPFIEFNNFYQQYAQDPESFVNMGTMPNTLNAIIEDFNDIVADVQEILEALCQNVEYLDGAQRHITLTFYVNGHVSGTATALLDPEAVGAALESQTLPEHDLIIFGADPEVPPTEDEMANAEAAQEMEHGPEQEQPTEEPAPEEMEQGQEQPVEEPEQDPEAAQEMQEAINTRLTNLIRIKHEMPLIEWNSAVAAGCTADVPRGYGPKLTRIPTGPTSSYPGWFNNDYKSKAFNIAKAKHLINDSCESSLHELARLYDKYNGQIDLSECTDEQLAIIHAHRVRATLSENADLNKVGNAMLIINIDNLNENAIDNIDDLYKEVLEKNGYANTPDNRKIVDKKALAEEILIESDEYESRWEKIKKILKKIGKGIAIGTLCGLSAVTIANVTGGAIAGPLAKFLSKIPRGVETAKAAKAALNSAKGVAKIAGATAAIGGVAAGTKAAIDKINDTDGSQYRNAENN